VRTGTTRFANASSAKDTRRKSANGCQQRTLRMRRTWVASSTHSTRTSQNLQAGGRAVVQVLNAQTPIPLRLT
jgi:hypothetical protein